MQTPGDIPGFLGIDHVGIAVESLEQAKARYCERLGFRCASEEEVRDQQVRVAFLPLGDSRLELIAPTSGSSPLAAFLAKRGEGMHHIAIRVRDLRQALRFMQSKQVSLIDTAPRPGAHGAKIAFVHPRAADGVLLELCEYPGTGNASLA